MKLSFTRILSLLAGLSVGLVANAQQDPHYSQFMHNKLVLNPGFAGNGDKFCFSALQRTQWMGFGGGMEAGDIPRGEAPSNLVASFNAPIGNHFGLGIHLLRDELGFEVSVNPTLSLSYKQPLKNGDVLAFGASAGYMQKSLDGTKLKPQEEGDPKIPTSAVSGNTMDFGAGVYYTKQSLFGFDDFYVGLSATHLNQGTVRYEWNGGSTVVNTKMHYYLMTGAKYNLTSQIALEPNILIKKDPAKIQADLNCYAVWNGSLYGGLTWRPMDAAVVLLGYRPQALQNLFVGYSYDLTTTRILNYSSGSHEFVLRYCFGISIPHTYKPPIPVLTPRFM